MRKTRAAAGLGALLAVAGATTAVALPTGHAARPAEKRRAAQAKALGQKLGIDPARVQKAMGEVRADRMKANRHERAVALGRQLGVSTPTAESALQKGMTARKAAKGKPKDKAKAFVAAVAKETGKSEDQVRSAVKAVAKAQLERRLKQAEANGTITHKRAEKIQKRIDSGKLGKRGRHALR